MAITLKEHIAALVAEVRKEGWGGRITISTTNVNTREAGVVCRRLEKVVSARTPETTWDRAWGPDLVRAVWIKTAPDFEKGTPPQMETRNSYWTAGLTAEELEVYQALRKDGLTPEAAEAAARRV